MGLDQVILVQTAGNTESFVLLDPRRNTGRIDIPIEILEGDEIPATC